VGEIPNFSEDEPLLSARIDASFFAELFRRTFPLISNLEFVDSIDLATNSSFAHLSFVSDCWRTE
jgi:hypothetical protein